MREVSGCIRVLCAGLWQKLEDHSWDVDVCLVAILVLDDIVVVVVIAVVVHNVIPAGDLLDVVSGRGQKAKEFLEAKGYTNVVNGGGPAVKELWDKFGSL